MKRLFFASLFCLFGLTAFSQNNGIFKGWASINADSAVFKTVVSNLQGTYGDIGALYYNRESNKWRIFADSTWIDLPLSGGGISGLLAGNGLYILNSDSVVFSGGEVRIDSATFLQNAAQLTGIGIDPAGNVTMYGELLASISAPQLLLTSTILDPGDYLQAGNLNWSLIVRPDSTYYGSTSNHLKFRHFRAELNSPDTVYLSPGFNSLGSSTDGGGDRYLYAAGSSSDIDMHFRNKGAGKKFHFETTAGSAIIAPGGAATLFVIEGGTAATVAVGGNATANAILLQGGADDAVIETAENLEVTTSSIGAASGNTTISTGSPISGNFASGNILIEPGTPSGSGNPGDIIINPLEGFLYVDDDATNASAGVANLTAGTVTVNNAKITAKTNIMLTTQVPGGTVGAVYISARVNGTSFTISSTNALDTSTVAWLLIERD